MKTKFASLERSSLTEVEKDNKFFSELEILNTLLNTIPNFALILNENRQIVYSNKLFNDFISLDNKSCMLGQRLGEAIKCIHAGEMEAGCGTSDACRECGAIHSIIESTKKNIKAAYESRITLLDGQALDLLVWTTPYTFNDKHYTIAILSDISLEKRKKVLERIFFHDILNTAGALDGYMDILELSDDPEQNEVIKNTKSLTHDLIEEITAQKHLASLESGEYDIHVSTFDTKELLNGIVDTFSNNIIFQNKFINIDHIDEITITTDRTLLRRVLFNLIKNGLEAVAEGQEVLVGCDRLKSEIVFHVINSGVIPQSIRLQIFQRSFSTKGEDRGLGTYSIKLLTEKYLKGRVYFESAIETGTVFYIVIPTDLNKKAEPVSTDPAIT